MNSSFNIITPGADTTLSTLLIEISTQGISYIAVNGQNTCIALSVYHFDAGITNDQVADNLKTIVSNQPVLQQPFKKVNIVYVFAEAVLVPHEFSNVQANEAMVELVYGDIADSITRYDFINKHHLHNIYRVPKQIDSVITHLFTQANHYHLYSLLPDIIKATGNNLYCIFSPKNITIQLIKEGKLQVIQSFVYKVPEDAVYHLLNVCESFDVPVTNTEIELSGMIDTHSNLYNELYKYFLHLSFVALPETFTYNDEIKKYPSHYFSHLFQLVACV